MTHRDLPTVRPAPLDLDKEKAEYVKMLRDAAGHILASANTIEDSMRLENGK